MNVHASFQNIIRELNQLQSPTAGSAHPPLFPGLISAGAQGSIIVNRKIEDEIQAVARWLLDQRPAAKKQHTLGEWRTRVRNAFGLAIVQLDHAASVENNIRTLKRLVEAELDSKPTTIGAKFTSMGCTLFEKPLAKPLVIGPVRIETKSDWLVRSNQNGHLPSDIRNRLERALNGNRPPKQSDPRLGLLERSIYCALNNSQLVCTVETNGLAAQMAETRAVIGARLALTAIALLWRRPSIALDGFRLSVDHGPRKMDFIHFATGENWSGGGRLKGLPFGPHVPSPGWIKLEQEARGFFDLAGKMIACWTSIADYNSASSLLRNLAQAIHFFWEGCRDENDLMAIVKFTAVLESLAQGKSGPILHLAVARLGIKENDKIVGERNIKQVVEWIYSAGRSRTLHGNNPDILHDWSDARAVAESLTRHCLVASMEWLQQNPTATDAKVLRSRDN